MKRLTAAIVMAAAAASAFSFGFGLKGGGPVRTEERRLSGFRSIEMSGAGELRVKRGAAFRVAVTMDEELLSAYESTVSGGVLRLGFRRGVAVTGLSRLEVEVTLPELEGLSLSGAAEARLLDAFSGRAFSFEASGSSALSGRIEYGRVELELSGGCRLRLEGRADSLELGLSGASVVDAAGLAAKTARVESSGASRIELRVQERLDVQTSGASSIRYYGDPKLKVGSSGASTVTKAGD